MLQNGNDFYDVCLKACFCEGGYYLAQEPLSAWAFQVIALAKLILSMFFLHEI